MCYYMLHNTAILEVRRHLGIPEEGFPSKQEALAWYKEHYYQAKGKVFNGNFGFRYNSQSEYVDFEYDLNPDYIKIYKPYPLDEEVALDREAKSLANKSGVAAWASPVFRLVIMIGELPEVLNLQFPNHLISPLDGIRVLVHPFEEKSLKDWRKTGQMLGLLKEKANEVKAPWTTTTYKPKRQSSYEYSYWQTYLAYMDAIGERRLLGQKSKKGLLVDTAKILVRDYGWNKVEDSYTIRRYLDRAEKRWHISTR
jgi:hypothetical protein